MRTTASAVLLSLALLAVAGMASAEEEIDPAAVLAQLRSSESSEAAWGAYHAGKHGIREAIPLLAELLKPTPGRWNEEGRYLRLAVLDALVRLDAKVPGDLETDLLRHLEEREFRESVLILLSSNPGENREALLELLGQSLQGPDLQYFTVAVGNLLSSTRAEGFGARLLEGLSIRTEIRIVDPGDPGDGLFGYGHTRYPLRGIELPEGFPPFGWYDLTGEAVPGGRLLADGIRPIWYQRRETKRSDPFMRAVPPVHWSHSCIFEWLGCLLGAPPDEVRISLGARKVVSLEDHDVYRATVRAARVDAIRPWFELLARCLRAKIITPREARRIEPDVRVEYEDLRTDRSRALPVIRFPDRVYLPDDHWPGGAFGARRGHRNLRALGGGHITDAAVDRGLDWLDRHQDVTGRWDSDRFSGRYSSDSCPGEGKADLDIVNTSLALLAFLGAGETDRFGGHQRAVRAGLDWLLDQQTRDGRFGPGSKRLTRYDHALATLVVGEACAMTGDPALMESVFRATRVLREAGKHDDPAAMVWEFRALSTAAGCGIEVAPEVFEALRAKLDRFEKEELALEGPLFPPSKPSLLAMVAICREARKHQWRYSMRGDPTVSAAAVGLTEPKHIGEWACGSLLLFQAGGVPWKNWNTRMKATLLPLQVIEGCEMGSWNPADFGDTDLGRVGVTACLVACLEVYYRYGKCF